LPVLLTILRQTKQFFPLRAGIFIFLPGDPNTADAETTPYSPPRVE